jgi:hypothetical protein
MTSKIKAGPPPALPSVVLELLTYLRMSPFLPPNLAKRLNLTPLAVSIVVRRRERIDRGNQYQLIND